MALAGGGDVRFRAPKRASRNTGPLGGDFLGNISERIDLSGGCCSNGLGEGRPALVLLHAVFWKADPDFGGNVTTYQSVAVAEESHTRWRRCELQLAAGGTVGEAYHAVRVLASRILGDE